MKKIIDRFGILIMWGWPGKIVVSLLQRSTYSRRQNRVPTVERLPNDFTATLHRSLMVKSLTNSPIERLLKRLMATFLNDFIILSRMCPQQLELGFPSMRMEVLPRPFSQLNSYPRDFDFFFYILVLGNSSAVEFKLCNPLKHSQVLSIGYSYSAQFIDYFVC